LFDINSFPVLEYPFQQSLLFFIILFKIYLFEFLFPSKTKEIFQKNIRIYFILKIINFGNFQLNKIWFHFEWFSMSQLLWVPEFILKFGLMFYQIASLIIYLLKNSYLHRLYLIRKLLKFFIFLSFISKTQVFV
jgi:hypothetical protein